MAMRTPENDVRPLCDHDHHDAQQNLTTPGPMKLAQANLTSPVEESKDKREPREPLVDPRSEKDCER